MNYKPRQPPPLSTHLSSLFLAGYARLWLSAPALAAEADRVGVVSHVKVLSDKVEDVSSPEAWKTILHQAGHERPGEGCWPSGGRW